MAQLKSRESYLPFLKSLQNLNQAEQKQRLQQLCRNDLYFLLVYGLHRHFADNDWFFARCREVEASPNGHLDLWAREHGKSLVITVTKTIQDILINPEITIGIFSHTRSMAKSFLRVIKREFEDNKFLIQTFDDIFYSNPHKDSPKWSEDDGLIVKRKGNPPESTIEAHGLVDGMPTGRHFELRVYDDVVTPQSVATPEQMAKTIDALDMSDNLGKVRGKARFIGTRYKMGDAYEEYIKRGIVKPRIYPATDNGKVDGNPVFFSETEWDRRVATQSPAIIASQMLQNPLAEDSVIFQSDWFNLWECDKELPYFEAVFLSLDGAFSEKTTADYSCLLAFGIFKAIEGSSRHSIMILDCFMERVNYPTLRDTCIEWWGNKYGKNDKSVDGFIIEDKASGQALVPDLRKAGIAVYPYNPGSLDKIARANLVSPLIRDGYFYMPESRNPARKGYPMNWLADWWEQMQYFPNVKNDDGVDSCVMALSVLDKMGYLRGKIAPERQQSYWQKLQRGGYSGDSVYSS